MQMVWHENETVNLYMAFLGIDFRVIQDNLCQGFISEYRQEFHDCNSNKGG